MEKFEIITNISNKYKIITNNFHHDNTLIDTVDFLKSNQIKFEPDILYLGKVSDFPKIPELDNPVNILLVQDSEHIPKYQNSEMLNLVVLVGCPPLDVLREEILSFLKIRKELQWKSMRLYDCLSTGKGLQTLVNLGSELLHNPLILYDQNHKVLAYSQNKLTHKPLCDEPLWNEIIEKGFYPYDVIQSTKAEGEVVNIFKGEKPNISKLLNRKQRTLNWHISIGGSIVAEVSVIEGNKTFDDNDIQLLIVLCSVISCELQKGKYFWQTKEAAVENLFSDLLNEKLQCNELIRERLKFIDFQLDNNIFVLVAKYIIDNAGNLPYIRDLLDTKINNGKCTIYDNKIVMVLTRPNKSLFSQDELNKLNKIFEENHMVAGISRDFADITKIKNYYLQSCKGVELGVDLDIKHKVHFYDDYAEFHLIEIAAKQENVLGICNPMLLKLMDDDRRNNDEMIKTLYVYLQSGNNLTESASILCIHRNTMIYRIKKIEEFLDVRIDDPKVTFKLNLSMKIIHFNKGTEFLEDSRDS